MFNITPATVENIDELVNLINSAYRGESSKKGWTTEADLLDGIRVDAQELRKIISNDHAVILKYTEEGKILGSVLLEKQGDSLYLGMLTVTPELQAKGIGKILLKTSEDEARKLGCKKIVMTVISVRSELINWYKRNGHIDTGVRKPFPTDASKFGMPKMPLEFIVMEKEILL